MIKWAVLALLCLSNGLMAQQKDSLSIGFDLKFGKQPLEIQKEYGTNQQKLIINTFKCYVSGFELHYTDGTSTTNKDYHLLDIEQFETLRFNVGGNPKKQIAKIRFHIGVDSLASVSGAMPGDLDATNGMYWAWQSGYINMKIEGTSAASKTRKNEFQFHIGGYLKPNDALRKVELETAKPQIAIDLAEFFTQVKLSEQNSIMVPGKAAMQLADVSVKMFKAE
jgi:hypothetical protein